jgi:hypothetical protein
MTSALPQNKVDLAVRIGMSADDGAQLAELLGRCPADVRDRIMDQLWLLAIFTEQRRRTRVAERPKFDTRANRLLALLDPGEGAAMRNVENAARELDALFGGFPGRWTLDRVRLSDDAASVLLSLHDWLNDVANARAA